VSGLEKALRNYQGHREFNREHAPAHRYCIVILLEHHRRIISMAQSKSYHKNPDVVTTDLDDGAILLNLNTKYYYTLNETGLSIWQAFDECGDPDAIATKLTDAYDVDRKQASAYLFELLKDLEKEGLIICDS
jgi:hypothetical protein